MRIVRPCRSRELQHEICDACGTDVALAFISSSRDHKTAGSVWPCEDRRGRRCSGALNTQVGDVAARNLWRAMATERAVGGRSATADSPLPPRPDDRQAQEPHHDGRWERRGGRARRREGADDLLHGAGEGSGSRSVLPAPLSHRARREGPDAAHAGKREPCDQRVSRREVLRRLVLHTGDAAGDGASRRHGEGPTDAREGGLSRCSRQLEAAGAVHGEGA